MIQSGKQSGLGFWQKSILRASSDRASEKECFGCT